MNEALTHFFLHTLVGRTIVGYLIMFTIPTLIPVLLVIVVGVKGLRHLFSYEPHPSVIHNLDPRIKVLYPFVIGTLTVVLNWNFVYLLLLFTLIPWLLVRPSFIRTRVVFAMVITPALGLIWSQGMFYIPNSGSYHLLFAFPPTIGWIGTPGLSTEGLLNGVQQAGRVMVAETATLILLLTTKPSEIIWAFYKFRMPAAVGLAFTVALRFLPQMIERMTTLLQVMQVRGYDLTRPGWREFAAWPAYLGRVLAAIPIVTVPLLINSLRSTSITAMVVDARAFGVKRERTSLQDHRLTHQDYAVIAVLILITLATILLVVFHIADRKG